MRLRAACRSAFLSHPVQNQSHTTSHHCLGCPEVPGAAEAGEVRGTTGVVPAGGTGVTTGGGWMGLLPTGGGRVGTTACAGAGTGRTKSKGPSLNRRRVR